MPRKGRSREFREVHSRDPEQAFWDVFPGRMRTAKVDMLGTGEPACIFSCWDGKLLRACLKAPALTGTLKFTSKIRCSFP